MQSPHDNLPDLQGNVYMLTFRREGHDDPDRFSTIQPNESEARARLRWLAREEWNTSVEVEAVEQLEGTRAEQLTELLSRYDAEDVTAPDTVKFEFARLLLEVPPEARREMIAAIPDTLREEILDLFDTPNDPKRS